MVSSKNHGGAQRVPLKKKVVAFSVGIVTVVANMAGSTTAMADYSGSSGAEAIEQQVVEKVREEVELINEAAFSLQLTVPGPLSRDRPRTFVPMASMKNEYVKAQEIAESMALTPHRGLTVDEVSVSVTDTQKTGTGKVIADLQITRKLAGEDDEWVDLIPHEIIYDDQGNIISVVAHDDDFFDSVNASDELEMLVPADATDKEGDLYKSAVDHGEEAATDSLPQAKLEMLEGTTFAKGLSATQKKRASAYAKKYALKANPSYFEYSQDCTNFVSQAMLAGWWQEKSHWYPDYRNDNAWWYGGIPRNSWTWSGAESFYRMARGSKGGLNRTKALPSVYQLVEGDILQYKHRGEGEMRHTMIVTGKTASGVPLLSYHSPKRKNVPFTSLKVKNVQWFTHRT